MEAGGAHAAQLRLLLLASLGIVAGPGVALAAACEEHIGGFTC